LAEDATRTSPPEVDRVAASRAAVAARRARAVVKAAVADGSRAALDVLEAAELEPEGIEGRLRVTEFLLSVPAIGTVKMQDALERLQISPAKRLGGLGRHQRVRLRAYLDERARPARRRRRGQLVVLAGPTAVGKGTVSTYIRENYPEVLLSVSATTRAPRPGETDGVNYYFVTDAEFDAMIASDELLEWAIVHNAFRYGTPRAPIEAALSEGTSVLLEIDLQGARNVRAAMPSARLIFLLPPTWDELVRRLTGRATEDPAEQQRRLATAKVELAAQDEFDFRVVNQSVADAAREVVDLMDIRATRSRPARP
jgi:guanylate kinase